MLVLVGALACARDSGKGIGKVRASIPKDALREGRGSAIVLEFGSPYCPACTAFARGPLREIIEPEVARGRIEFVYVDVSPPGVPSLAATALRCLDGPLGDRLRLVSDSIEHLRDARSAAAFVARHSRRGVGTAAQCLHDAAALGALERGRAVAESLHVREIPTFVVGTPSANGRVVGRAVVGADLPAELRAAIDLALRTP
ncbi:MAG: thioredoxin domain-containing protein [Gemmatimonadaceae bacterium]|nr:thioredoxin domain-containing protein [Gemmatimonadaceae bacterium]